MPLPFSLQFPSSKFQAPTKSSSKKKGEIHTLRRKLLKNKHLPNHKIPMEFFPIERTIIFRVFLFWFAASIKPQQSQQHRRQRPRPARDGGFRCMCRPERWAAPETSRPSELPSALISSSLRMSVPALVSLTISSSAVFMSSAFIPGTLSIIPTLLSLFTPVAPNGPSCPHELTTTFASITFGSIHDCVSWFIDTRAQLVTTPPTFPSFIIRSSAATALKSFTLGLAKSLLMMVDVKRAACFITT
ncbi:hypothetical protein VitviT2T_029794 [Vitis vinifera]|uniref:Uncharacterized protein n=1 Tax=Vitis vinifera TaxID=29760 RepID=A0ABY9DY68_VITVI|nr:hypothetical protein VitviT2T_029794 [Vitis vinifera]